MEFQAGAALDDDSGTRQCVGNLEKRHVFVGARLRDSYRL